MSLAGALNLTDGPVSRIGDETPQPSYQPSRRSFDVHNEDLKKLLMQNPTNYQKAKELVCMSPFLH